MSKAPVFFIWFIFNERKAVSSSGTEGSFLLFFLSTEMTNMIVNQCYAEPSEAHAVPTGHRLWRGMHVSHLLLFGHPLAPYNDTLIHIYWQVVSLLYSSTTVPKKLGTRGGCLFESSVLNPPLPLGNNSFCAYVSNTSQRNKTCDFDLAWVQIPVALDTEIAPYRLITIDTPPIVPLLPLQHRSRWQWIGKIQDKKNPLCVPKNTYLQP